MRVFVLVTIIVLTYYLVSNNHIHIYIYTSLLYLYETSEEEEVEEMSGNTKQRRDHTAQALDFESST